MHVAATFNGTTSTIYINGVADNSVVFGQVQINQNTAELQIGARKGGNQWQGDLDEVMLFNRALSSSEIASLIQENQALRISTSISKENQKEESQMELIESDQDTMLGFKIYPNPVDDKLNVLMNSMEETFVEIMVYDMMGRLYIHNSVKTDSGRIELDFSSIKMASGTYLLMLDQGKGKMKRVKFIKK